MDPTRFVRPPGGHGDPVLMGIAQNTADLLGGEREYQCLRRAAEAAQGVGEVLRGDAVKDEPGLVSHDVPDRLPVNPHRSFLLFKGSPSL